LLKYGLPEDIWFHVDNLSSAHVYLRLSEGETIEDIPEEVLEDCTQLVKHNSIQGNKKTNITVVYTPYINLNKTPDMAPGQVGFHDEAQVRKARVEKRINQIINRLEKTKEERFPDLIQEKEDRRRQEEHKQKRLKQQKLLQEKTDAEEKRQQRELRSYDSIMTSGELTSNKDGANLEEDFM